MAKPDLENGYLLIAHELFAALMCAGFTKWEQVVIREVLSQIFGPRKSKTATFSPTEIARQVSTHKESIVRAARTLIASNVLAKVGDMEYRFVKDYEAWTRDGEPRLSSFERAYCESAKTINVSNKRGNSGAPHPSTKDGNNSAPISTEQGNNGAPDGNMGAPVREHGRSPSGTMALPSISRPPNPPIEEPARGIEKREREKGEEAPRPATLRASDTPEALRACNLAAEIGGDVSWAIWASRRIQMGNSPQEIEAAMSEAVNIGIMNQTYVGKIAARLQREGLPKVQAGGKFNSRVKSSEPTPPLIELPKDHSWKGPSYRKGQT